MYINRLNSFDEVAACYEKTPVLKSKHHKVEQDVRPIGSRRRKTERIIKISDKCYVLSCGGDVDPVFNWVRGRDYLEKFPITPKETEMMSPIVWRKHKDGSETITVRNGWGDWQHNAVYSFLARTLPRELWFRINRQGRQAIYNRSEGKEYYLPKTKTVPRHIHEYYLDHHKKGIAWAKMYYSSGQLKFDNMSLTFKRKDDGTFELLGSAPKEMVKRTRVNVDEKAKYKEAINEIFAWSMTMYPLMRDQLDWNFRQDMAKQLGDMAKENKIAGWCVAWQDTFSRCQPTLIRSIIKDRAHPMRYFFGVAAMYEIKSATTGWNVDGLDEEGRKKRARAYYNRWINKLAGFASIVKEEK
jgi:hypothetical protein